MVQMIHDYTFTPITGIYLYKYMIVFLQFFSINSGEELKQERTEIIKKDDSKCFSISNFLSEAECKYDY